MRPDQGAHPVRISEALRFVLEEGDHGVRPVRHVVEGLPKQQVEGLCYARKVPLIYGRAALNNWQAFADSKVASISPRGTI